MGMDEKRTYEVMCDVFPGLSNLAEIRELQIKNAKARTDNAETWVERVTSNETLKAIVELVDAKIELARLDGGNGTSE